MARTVKSPVVAEVVVAEKTITVIQFAKLIGRPPQQVYSMIRTGSLPQELIVYLPRPDGRKAQPTLLVDSATTWWNERLAKRSQGVTQVVTSADQVIARMQDMMAQSEDPEVKKIADALAKVIASFAK